jgi:hypothetical protein
MVYNKPVYGITVPLSSAFCLYCAQIIINFIKLDDGVKHYRRHYNSEDLDTLHRNYTLLFLPAGYHYCCGISAA